MTRLGELELNDAAHAAAGNYEKFSCFAWFRKSDLKKPEDWAVIYTHNRDSGLLDQSNAAVIRKAMKPFTKGDDPNVVFESHHHWAVGHVDGFSLRIFNRGRITKHSAPTTRLPYRLPNTQFWTRAITARGNSTPRSRTSVKRHGD